MAFFNGKQLTFDTVGATGTANAINSELAYQIYLRMYIGPEAPADLRNGLMGLTKLPRTGGGSRDSDS